MSKHFLLNPYINETSKETIQKIEKEKSLVSKSASDKRNRENKEILSQECELKYVEGRVIIKIDVENKNWHTFENGQTIRRERQFNELNRRITEPVNAIVVSAKDIPEGAEILIHPNAIHDTYRIFNYQKLSGKLEGSDIRYYSIREDECFLWRKGDKWMPLFPFETALRIFKPYSGIIEGIPPTKIKDVLYVTSGELEGSVVKTIDHSDFEIIFQGTGGREEKIIRFRPFGDPRNGREEEAIAVMDSMTDELQDGKLLIGLEPSDAKTLNITAYAD